MTLTVLGSQNLERESQMWEQIMRNVLGQGSFATLDKIVREPARESRTVA
ncbi:MAG: hypothetical protein ABSC50_06555 [Candidatus Bathyarchaeia archaeon]